MSISLPAVWSTSGSFSSGSQTALLQPNNGVGGFVADYMEIQNLTSVGMFASYSGASFLILPYAKIELPGPISTVSLTPASTPSTGSSWPVMYTAVASANVGKLPTQTAGFATEFALISGSSGGGGSGGAPTTSPYVLWGDTVPTELTNAIAARDLGSQLEFANSPNPSNDSIQAITANICVTTSPTMSNGMGPAVVFRNEGSGTNADLGDLRFFKSVASGGASAAFGLGVGHTNVFEVSHDGIVMSGSDNKGVIAVGAADLIVGTQGTGVVRFKSINTENLQLGTDYLRATNGAFDIEGYNGALGLKAGAGQLISMTESGGTDGFFVTGTTAYIGSPSSPQGWSFSNGNMSGSSGTGEILNIANASLDTSAPSWGQVKAYADSASITGSLVWGASSTGITSQQGLLNYGYGNAAPQIGTSKYYGYWLAPENVILKSITIYNNTPSTGVNDQTFTVLNGLTPTAITVTLPLGAGTATASGSVLVTAGSVITVGFANGADVTDVGAQDLMCYVTYVKD